MPTIHPLSAEIKSIIGHDVRLLEQLFDAQSSSDLFNTLYETLSWQSHQIKLFGRLLDQPRLTAFYGDYGIHYTYSNLTLTAEPFTQELLFIKQTIESVCQTTFNCVLANLYRDGSDSMGWHSDDEPSLGDQPTIASVSFGAERIFHLRHKFDQSMPTQKVLLSHASLLIMQGQSQSHWQHQLPKSKRVALPRINLTFRRIV